MTTVLHSALDGHLRASYELKSPLMPCSGTVALKQTNKLGRGGEKERENDRERERGTNTALYVGMFVLGEPRAVILGICPAVERDTSKTEFISKTRSESHRSHNFSLPWGIFKD